MKLLADESCAGPVIRALRDAGHDLVAIAEVQVGARDEAVIERALREDRVVITEDRDFGELVFARGHSTTGVLFVKFHRKARSLKAASVVEAVAKLGVRLHASFTVVEATRVRVRRRP